MFISLRHDIRLIAKRIKRIVLAFLLGCCALTLAAQESIPVNYKGEKPAIDDDEEVDVDESANAFKQAWIRYRQGAAQPAYLLTKCR